MNDSTFYFHLNTSKLPDSADLDTIFPMVYNDSPSLLIHSFFQHPAQAIAPVMNSISGYDWYIYISLILSFGVALIWYFIPERLSTIFSVSVKSDVLKLNERENPDPGAVVTFFFLINSLVNMSFLAFYALRNLLEYDFGTMDIWKIMLYLTAVISAVFILKMAIIGIAGFIFNTLEMAKKQVRLYFNSNIALGVILLPLLFVLAIVQSPILLFIILFFVAIIFLIRWVQVIRLGLSITHFNFFHLILYLCTLEIIPMLILFKIFM